MLIAQENLRAYVKESTPLELKWLDSILSFQDRSYKARMYGDGYMHLLDKRNNSFPTGLVGSVRKRAQKDGKRVDLVDRRLRPISPDPQALVDWLRPHQVDALAAARQHARGVFHHVTGCVAGDTMIGVHRAGKSYELTIRELFERENRINPHSAARLRHDIQTQVRFRDTCGTIRLGELSAVVYSGRKRTYELRLDNGASIRATRDHKFLTPRGWVKLGRLRIDDAIYAEGRAHRVPRPKSWYQQVSRLLHHPHAGRRAVGYVYSRFSVPKHRLVYEAHINGLSFAEYVRRLRSGVIDGFTFLDPSVHVHHVDGDARNNALDNLELLDGIEHCRQHGRAGNFRNVLSSTVLARVIAISEYGIEDTYDICMAQEPHCFIANGIVAHNSGKTELMVALTEVYPTRWLILVNKKDLLRQTAERFEKRTGERVGLVGDGKAEYGRRITVAMFQSIAAGLRGQHRGKVVAFLQGIRAVSVDECHVTPAATYWRVMMALPNAYYRYGFSGTPFARGDQKSLYVVATLGPAIHRVTAEDLATVGLLARPKIRLVPVVHKASQSTTWNGVYAECVIGNAERNRTLVAIAKHVAKPSLLFVKSIDHGRLLAQMLEEAGVSSEFVWGAKKTLARHAALRRLVHGDVDVLICNVIFQEGIDIPELMSVIIGSGGKSVIMVLQDIGRGMRRHSADGQVVKDEFEVFDVQDLGCGCRARHKSCKWLARHTQDRLRAFAVEKYPVFVTPVSKLEGG